ncbi:MAG: hypothetical protein RMK91_11565 [Pseudanabaenaceae cyanobacterium SKYGB_i_bin29]|nr:hypothetical protein [Pseudanabaenaceae cyanobacterium SKYG29]MDW8422491.1 hypothetical protein [Pseudanabaenaceae cyanobacterium SKYGB_i_bin29]
MDEQELFQYFLEQEPFITDPEQDKLAFLDRGYFASCWSNEVHLFSRRLEQTTINNLPQGKVPLIDDCFLSFLHPSITEACVSVIDAKGNLHWYGRRATQPVQLWSGTKFLPIYYLLSQVDVEESPYEWWIRDVDNDRLFSFAALVDLVFTYIEGDNVSNSIALMFKSFFSPEELTRWLQKLTGNQDDIFRGGYGGPAFLAYPILQTKDAREIMRGQHHHRGQNLVSVYALTRALSELAWSDTKRNPDRYDLLIQGMAKDTARYLDVALEHLSLSLSQVVIISKMGFGRSEERNRSELVYAALLSSQELNICLTFKTALNSHDPAQEARHLDARMATEVTKTVTALGHFYTL